MPSFAFFDLDHTLLPFDTQTLFANFVQRRQRVRSLFLLKFIPIALLRAVKAVPTVKAKRAFMGYLEGMKQQEVQELAAEFAETVVKPWVYPELKAIIEEHRQAGRTLILNTASPDFYARAIANALGFDHCIATKVEPHAVMPFMPTVKGHNNKREEKIAAMKREIPAVAAATAADLASSWAYSDSAADLPLLQFAGNGVLVHPSPSLAAIGKDKGWPVLKPARPYQGKVGDMFTAALQVAGLYGSAKK